MTFNDYILNPMGKHNAVLNSASRELMRKTYTKKFDNILLREKGNIQCNLFYNSKNKEYWAYIKIPSEVVRKFYYDVVIKFTPGRDVKGEQNDLFDYNVQFYSNDPAFVFTYAYVFNKRDMFVKELSRKMSKTALKTPAREKNPNNNVGYVKSLYFAYLFMKNKALNKRNKFESSTTPYSNIASYFENIMNADQKIEERQLEGSKVSSKKKIELDADTVRKVRRVGGADVDMSGIQVRTTKKVGNIKTSSTVGGVKQTPKTKRK